MLLAESARAFLYQGEVKVARKFRQVGDAGLAGLDILEQGLGQREDRIGHRIDGDACRLRPQEVLHGSECQRGGVGICHLFTTKTPLIAKSKQTRPAYWQGRLQASPPGYPSYVAYATDMSYHLWAGRGACVDAD